MKKLIGTLVINAALTTVLWPATIQSSFEDKYIGNEGRPSVGNGEFYAIGSGHLWYTWNGLTDPFFTADGSKAYEDLGANAKSDINIQIELFRILSYAYLSECSKSGRDSQRITFLRDRLKTIYHELQMDRDLRS